MGKLFKKDGEEDTPNRKALFGSRSKNKAQPEQPTNPYAKPIPTDPYTKAKFYAGVNPMKPSDQPGAPNQMSGPPAGYAPGPAGPPGGNGFPPDVKPGSYTPNQYGNQGGYGSDRFGGGGASSRYGAGGYGGLGSADPNNPGDANRDALFGGAEERVAQQQPGGAPPPYSSQDGGYPGGSNEYSNTSMYQERQLTAEEEEDEEIQAIKEEMKFVKQGDTEDVGRETLARLGAHGEHVHDTEKSLDMATIEGRIAEDKAKELKQLNKSMFAMRVSNPFTSARRRRERDEKILSNHRSDRDVREGTRHEAFQGNQRMEMTFREIDRDARMPAGKSKKNMTERAKYQFEADSEDEAMEDEIEGNLNLIHGAAGRLNGLSRVTGRELDEQNRHLERITGKSDFVDDQLAMNRARLDRIN
ncbi:hypothetical protein PHISP_00052 [Aspergillus sp. HF37]|nr:hypothetical protein PHISP_00052 [Aspergillus sp. HF37]